MFGDMILMIFTLILSWDTPTAALGGYVQCGREGFLLCQCLELTMNKNISDDKELAFLPKNNQQPAVD